MIPNKLDFKISSLVDHFQILSPFESKALNEAQLVELGQTVAPLKNRGGLEQFIADMASSHSVTWRIYLKYLARNYLTFISDNLNIYRLIKDYKLLENEWAVQEKPPPDSLHEAILKGLEDLKKKYLSLDSQPDEIEALLAKIEVHQKNLLKLSYLYHNFFEESTERTFCLIPYKNKILSQPLDKALVDSISLFSKGIRKLTKQKFHKLKQKIFDVDKKHSFLCRQIDNLKIDQENLEAQRKKIPIINLFIEELYKSYEKWEQRNHLPPDELLNELTHKHLNLAAIVHLIQDVRALFSPKQLPIVDKALREIPLKRFLQNYLNGNQVIEDIEKAQIKEKILEYIRIVRKEQQKKTPRKYPISSQSIKQQAQLFKAERKSKVWVGKGNPINDLTQGNENIVYKLKQPDSSSIAAFYKAAGEKVKPAAIMETLMWDIAVILGLEDLFTATKISTFSTGNPLPEREQTTTWKEQKFSYADEKEFDIAFERGVADASLKGSLQANQKGETLYEYLNQNTKSPHTINKKELARATLASIVFGMFDAHTNNIILNKEGKIKFFDNTRCLSNSNGILNWNSDLLLPYRSGLLELSNSHESLSKSEIQYLISELDQIKNKVPRLENFLNLTKTRKKIHSLPTGWFDTDKAIDAMEERISRLSNALKTGHIQSLADCVFAVFPYFKFVSALQYITSYQSGVRSEDRLFTEALSPATVESIRDLISTCKQAGIDPRLLLKWCEGNSRSFKEILKKISKKLIKKNTPVTRGSKVENILENIAVLANHDIVSVR